eukprot:2903450-Pleurochrysis_carterae.AAC.2
MGASVKERNAHPQAYCKSDGWLGPERARLSQDEHNEKKSNVSTVWEAFLALVERTRQSVRQAGSAQSHAHAHTRPPAQAIAPSLSLSSSLLSFLLNLLPPSPAHRCAEGRAEDAGCAPVRQPRRGGVGERG